MREFYLFIIFVVASIMGAVIVQGYAADSLKIDVGVAHDYHSLTKAIVICDKYNQCVAQDFYVECDGAYIVNITAIGTGVRVGADAKGLEEWC